MRCSSIRPRTHRFSPVVLSAGVIGLLSVLPVFCPVAEARDTPTVDTTVSPTLQGVVTGVEDADPAEPPHRHGVLGSPTPMPMPQAPWPLPEPGPRRWQMVTYDLRTGVQTVRDVSKDPGPGPMVVPGGDGIAAGEGGMIVGKTFSSLAQVPNPRLGDYPKHVKVYSWFETASGDTVVGGCSGTLLDPKLVLVAGHCVFSHEISGIPVEDWAFQVKVVPALDGVDQPFGESYSPVLHSWTEWTLDWDYRHDLGLIELDRPVGVLTGWRGYGASDDCGFWESPWWTVNSYPGTSPYSGVDMYTMTGDFDLCINLPGNVYYDGIAYKGMSGAGTIRDNVAYGVLSFTIPGQVGSARLTPGKVTHVGNVIQATRPPTFNLVPLVASTTTSTVEAGQPLADLTYFVTNAAAGAFSGTVVGNVYLSTDDDIDPSDTLVQTHYFGSTLQTYWGVNVNTTPPPTIPAGTPAGDYWVGIILDVPGDYHTYDNDTDGFDAAPVTVICTTPPAPTLLAPPANSTCQPVDALLDWGAVPQASSYKVQIGLSCGSGPIYQTTSSSYAASLGHDTTYHWRVQADRACGSSSDWSACFSFRTEEVNSPPTLVAPLDDSTCMATAVILDWSTGGEPGVSEVQVGLACGTGTVHSTTASAQSVVGLSPAATYHWRVRKANLCGNFGAWTACWEFTTAPTGLDVPTLLAPPDASSCNDSSVSVDWSDVPDATGYSVQIGSTCGSGAVVATVTSSYDAVGLGDGLYHWRARAENDCGIVGEWSACREFTVYTGILFVDADATGGANDGTSWADAFTDLQSALLLSSCSATAEVWVAEGTYLPTGDMDISVSFVLPPGFQLYGGFDGTETQRSQRDWVQHPTILSGNLPGGKMPTNSTHVVDADVADASSVLDGFQIIDGEAAGTHGGGLLVGGNPTLANVVISNCTGNYGAGMSVSGAPILVDVSFLGNDAAISGGGLHVYPSAAMVATGLVFDGNSASGDGGNLYCGSENSSFTHVTIQGGSAQDGAGAFLGGGTFQDVSVSACTATGEGGGVVIGGTTDVTGLVLTGNSAFWGGGLLANLGSPTVRNVVAVDNVAVEGGGVFVRDGTPVLTGLTIAGNTASSGHDLLCFSGYATVFNSVFWNDFPGSVASSGGIAFFANSDVRGSGGSSAWTLPFGFDGGGNMDVDPLFVDYVGRNLRLSAASPLLGAGIDHGDLGDSDLDGNPRVSGPTVDIGSYEYQCPPGATRIYVDGDAVAANDGTSWGDAYTDLQSALAPRPCFTEVWVAEGTYVPTNTVDREATFQVPAGTVLLGGFSGAEVTADDRDPNLHATILSGEIGAVGSSDNTHHVVTTPPNSSLTTIDGFTVRDGNALGGMAEHGGGMSLAGSVLIQNVQIVENQAADGAGISASGPVVILDCVLKNNISTNYGGGMYVTADVTVINTVFFANGAFVGGAVFADASSPAFLNVTLAENTEPLPGLGGAFACLNGTPTVRNSILTNPGSEVIWIGSAPTMRYCLVEGSEVWNEAEHGIDGGGNVAGDPLFVNLAAGDLHLASASSAAYGTGDPDPTGLPPTDLDGNPRVVNGNVDMGAYESQVVSTGREDLPPLTATVALEQPYPNPFNPQVTIPLDLSSRVDVSLVIFDARGRKVRTLASGVYPAGRHEVIWKGVDDAGRSMPSGVYFVRMESSLGVQRRTLVLVR